MNESFYQIAIDGYSSCGKSTLARDLAQAINFVHVDSGAMYRAVTLYVLDNDIPVDDETQIDAVIQDLDIDFIMEDGRRLVRLNGQVVEPAIREQRISDMVSQVSVIRSVRDHLVRLQREMSQTLNVIMEGRDIGTVVFPDAKVKLFITADVDVRVQRRWSELKSKGLKTTEEEVRKNLLLRDHIDSTREIAPLRQAEDAIVIDNSHLDRKGQLAHAVDIVKKKMGRAGERFSG